MWNEAQFTAQLIKRGNPTSSVYLIAETNQVAIDALIPESPRGEMFILREKNDKEIDKQAVFDFFSEVKKTLQKIRNPSLRKAPGKLLHP